MHRRCPLLIRAPAAALSVVAAGVVAVAAATPPAVPRGDAERGRAVYLELRCHSCHGTVGQGSGFSGGGPKLLPDLFPWEAFLQQMRRPRLDMPAYLPRWVSDQDVADMYAYLERLRDAPARR